MFVLKALLFCALCAYAYSQAQPHTTPVPILKQINKQNDDGSYSFGYEAADGSFKIETKYPNGDVAGKYGYVDVDGKVREISYGASSQRGFEPQGTGIMVPPPTLNDPNTNALTDGQEDDGQYREDPRIYEDPKYNGKLQHRPSSSFSFKIPSQKSTIQSPQPQQSYTQQNYQQEYQQPQYQQQQRSLFSQSSFLNQAPQQFNQAPQQFNQPQQYNQPSYTQDFRPQSQIFHQQPQFSYQSYTPQYQPQYQSYQQPSYQSQNYNPFAGHPAQNIDPNTGSYTINFTG